MNILVKEQLLKVLNHPLRVPVSIGVVAFSAGTGLGYILGKRKRYEIYEVPDQTLWGDITEDEKTEIMTKELAKRESERFVVPIEDVPSDVIERHPAVTQGQDFVTQKINEYRRNEDGKVVRVEEEAEETVITTNVFTNDNDDWDYMEELKNRTPSQPYIINKDEFFSDEVGYTQSTLTYYAGDNILVDEDEAPIYNHRDLVGELKFGHGSGDSNVVYIRNDNRKAEYEVLLDSGLYSVEVLGLEIENNERARDLKHSHNRKFRME